MPTLSRSADAVVSEQPVDVVVMPRCGGPTLIVTLSCGVVEEDQLLCQCANRVKNKDARRGGLGKVDG